MPDRAALLRLRQDVQRDVVAAEGLLRELEQRASSLDAAEPVLLGWAAVTLHQFYTALETCFERICHALEGSLPAGAESHQALLHDMTLDLADLRPPVLRNETAAALRPLLRFRHFVRHAYAVAWDAERIAEVLQAARKAWPMAHNDLTEFVAFLDEVGAQT